MAQVDDSMRRPTRQPATPARPSRTYGPVDPGVPGQRPDSDQVGTARDGSPLFGAEWYEEPRDDLLDGFRSQFTPPLHAIIECRTAPRYRVLDCRVLSEDPQGSHLGEYVITMSQSFRVRPPRRDGRELVGSFVRIRILLMPGGRARQY